MFARFRNRRTDRVTRIKHQETFLMKENFIYPVFVVEGKKIKTPIHSMNNIYRTSIDILINELEHLFKSGLKSILIFGIPDEKGIEQSYSKTGIVQNAVRTIKRELPELEIITDVCLCSYTENGQCHIGENDKTCELLAEIALSHMESGADIVAPSDMMDGRVYFIKQKLLQYNNIKTKIMSYSAKYASNFYGPFRDAASCSPKSGNRKDYQMDPPNSNEAMNEIKADIEEGADSVIIKPALSYLDIIYRAKKTFNVPIIAYNVSGEYTMVNKMIEEKLAGNELIYETVISMKRAGADRIITYFTPYFLENLDEIQSL